MGSSIESGNKPAPNCDEDLCFGIQIAVKTFSGPNDFSSAESGPLLKLVEYSCYRVTSSHAE